MDAIDSAKLQKLVFKAVDEETGERRAYLNECLEDTWFGTPESLTEFVENNGWENEPLEFIAKEYVENA
jgi:hypothetical protein